jgi:hypothetical protein
VLCFHWLNYVLTKNKSYFPKTCDLIVIAIVIMQFNEILHKWLSVYRKSSFYEGFRNAQCSELLKKQTQEKNQNIAG